MRSVVAAIVLMAGIAHLASAQAAECPSDAYSLSLAEGQALACTCTGPVNTVSAIYGTDRYTSDSGLCAAAVHAGIIPADKGGDVSVYLGGGCTAFKGEERNGIASREWGSYDKTFAFVTPLPECAGGAAAVASTSEPAAEPPKAPPPPERAPGPAPDAGPDDWQARADKFAKALPKPLDGWTSTDPRGEWANDSMNGRYVAGVVWYKKGGNTMNSDVFVQIINAPDGGAYEIGERLWTEEAYRTERKAAKGEFAGREAVIMDPEGDQTIFYRMDNGIFVVVSRLKSHDITEADLEAYAKALDFAKIAKLSPT